MALDIVWLLNSSAAAGLLCCFRLCRSLHSPQSSPTAIWYRCLSFAVDLFIPCLKVPQCSTQWFLIKNLFYSFWCPSRFNSWSTPLHSVHLEHCKHCFSTWPHGPPIC